MASSLKRKAVKGISWNLLERFGVQGMSFIMGIIMARLLTPEAYGLIGMIVVFFAIAEVFVRSGFGEAYVQKKEVTDVDANTVFFTNFLISVLLYIILYYSAPAISRFYEEPKLIGLTRIMGLMIIINAFNVIQRAQISRNLNFKRKTKITLISTMASGLAGITAAFYGFGVWSIVIQRMGNRLFTTSGLWITSKWTPNYQVSKASFKSMFSFGSWLLFSNILREIFNNIYKLTIGKFFPAAQLGYYTKAKSFQEIASRQWTQAVSSVSFPVFSQVQDDKQRLQQAMSRFLTHTMVFIMPLMITLLVVAEPFVMLLLTEKWAPMIPFLQLLCIVGFLYPLHSVNVQVLLAQGKSQLNFNLAMIKNGLRVLNIIVMYRYGVIYIIIGEVVLSFIALLINTYYTKKMIDYGFIKQIRDIAKIAIGAFLAGIITFGFSLLFDNYWVHLFGGTVLSFGLFASIQYIINRKLFLEIIDLKNFFNKQKQ